MKTAATPTMTQPKTDTSLRVRSKLRAGAIWSDATGHFDFRSPRFLPTIPNE